MVEVELDNRDDFLKIMETLTRIGIAFKKDEKDCLIQSCHIFHKQGKYAVAHFKEMFAVDGKPIDFDTTDVGRRNRIIKLLEEWGLLKVVDPSRISENIAPMNTVRIIPYKQKDQWLLESKYTMGS
jgi:hypothetical protein